MKNIGLITIGQSPREDITDDMKSILKTNFNLIELGALDSLSREFIETNLFPEVNSKILITRLNDKKHVTIGEEKIINLLQEKIDFLNLKTDIDKIIIICTSNFEHNFISKIPIFYSGNIVKKYINSFMNKRILAFVPLEEQIPIFKKEWNKNIDVAYLNPYIDFNYQIKIEKNYDFIYLNCLGYNFIFKTKIETLFNKKVIIPREILCEFIKNN